MFRTDTASFASGAWSNTTSHQSNLYPSPNSPYSASLAVETYTSYGIPPSKIYIGIPLYSRGFSGSKGLGTPCTGASPDTSWEQGVVDYKNLPVAGAVEYWDDSARAGYSFDAEKGIVNSYDVPRAVREKCEYVKRMGLGGVIIWESISPSSYLVPKILVDC